MLDSHHDCNWWLGLKKLFLVGGVGLWCVAGFVVKNAAVAQITPDTTLGNESSQVKTGVNVRGRIIDGIDGGAVRGANLFHSFLEFNVGNGQRVYFANPIGVENILTRVTGNRRSDILGTLGVLGNANLFLINPNGILFGQNARLDIAGSFVATTAESAIFDHNFAFSATNPQAPPLLTINVPLGLQFATNPGNIQLQRARLRVADGETLALIGGNVSLNNALVLALGGRVELGGVTAPGTVGLAKSGNNLSFRFPDAVVRADVSLTNRSIVDVTAGGGGSIAINSRNLDILRGSFLGAGIAPQSGSPESKAGAIDINTTGVISVASLGSISNEVLPTGVGEGGNINITTRSLQVSDGSQVSASTWGFGNAGNVNINATDTVTLVGKGNDGLPSGAFSVVERIGRGKGGEVNINTGSLFLTDGAQVNTITAGRGDAGKINIQARDRVVVTDGGRIFSNSFGLGNAGNVTITAGDSILFDGVGSDGFGSAVATQIGSFSIGDGGNIDLTARELSLTNGAQLATTTFGQGNAGNVTINVSDKVLIDGLGTTGFSSGVASVVALPGVGNGGRIDITAGSLLVSNSGRVSASSFGQGNAGDIKITAQQSVAIDGVGSNGSSSAIGSQLGDKAKGRGGNIDLTARALSISNGANLSTTTFGEGDAGDVRITVQDSVVVDGVGSNKLPSAVLSNVEDTAIGNGGKIAIVGESLLLTNGAELVASTTGKGDAGSITVTANSVDAASGGRLLSTTASANKAGNITLTVQDRITLAGNNSGLFANTTANSTGDGGSIFIDPKTLTVRDGARIAVDSQGSGIGGNIAIQAGSFTLDNSAIISAETASNTGGDIQLQLQDLLLMRRNSKISTTAGNAQSGGDGGNIIINTPFVLAIESENSDITANAFKGNGGQVQITTEGIFGIQFRQQENPATSDITASSTFGSSGIVQINTPDVDPSRGLAPLPTNLVDATGLIAQNCPGNGGATAHSQSEFVITGRGGLPPQPSEPLSSDAVWQDLQLHAPLSTQQSAFYENNNQQPIMEAQAWKIAPDGSVLLVAQVPIKPTFVSCAIPPVSQN